MFMVNESKLKFFQRCTLNAHEMYGILYFNMLDAMICSGCIGIGDNEVFSMILDMNFVNLFTDSEDDIDEVFDSFICSTEAYNEVADFVDSLLSKGINPLTDLYARFVGTRDYGVCVLDFFNSLREKIVKANNGISISALKEADVIRWGDEVDYYDMDIVFRNL